MYIIIIYNNLFYNNNILLLIYIIMPRITKNKQKSNKKVKTNRKQKKEIVSFIVVKKTKKTRKTRKTQKGGTEQQELAKAISTLLDKYGKTNRNVWVVTKNLADKKIIESIKKNIINSTTDTKTIFGKDYEIVTGRMEEKIILEINKKTPKTGDVKYNRYSPTDNTSPEKVEQFIKTGTAPLPKDTFLEKVYPELKNLDWGKEDEDTMDNIQKAINYYKKIEAEMKLINLTDDEKNVLFKTFEKYVRAPVRLWLMDIEQEIERIQNEEHDDVLEARQELENLISRDNNGPFYITFQELSESDQQKIKTQMAGVLEEVEQREKEPEEGSEEASENPDEEEKRETVPSEAEQNLINKFKTEVWDGVDLLTYPSPDVLNQWLVTNKTQYDAIVDDRETLDAEIANLRSLHPGVGGKRKSKKTNKVRKHRGIVQTGGSAGRLRKGYKYTGRRLKNGQAEIKKVKQTRK